MTRAADAPRDEISPLADPALRLAAVVIDAAIGLSPLIVLMPLAVAVRSVDLIRWASYLYWLVPAVVFVVDLVLLHRFGQTIGKRILGLRIVRSDGSRATLARICWRRSVIPGAIGAVPLLGELFLLVDSLFVFTNGRKTVHDRIAGTIVVDLRRMPPQPPKKF